MPDVKVSEDVAAINAGKALKDGANYIVNGRTYGAHENGTLYPISGDGFYTLDRGAYQALGVYQKFGATERAEMILDRMKTIPESRTDALNVYLEGLKRLKK